ncbi:MAG: 3-oxoadipate enol-lactonase [Pyrinomonadaceae bacterium]|nr:3-oxoadipate enol-lactonase [Pyrinomonadaceae bacterium]
MKSLTVDGLRLAYRLDGDEHSPPMVFVNSLGCDLRMWNPQVAALSNSFRILRYDIRGHGQSGPSPEAFTIERLGLDLLALLDELSIGRTHICGLSLGGMIALWLTIHHPERIERAVFANTAARIGTVEGWNARIGAVESGGMAAVREVVVARFLSEPFRARQPETAQWVGDMLEATIPEGYIAACVALRDADLRHLIHKIQVPSLVLAAALDESTPPAQAQELHDAIRGSELRIFPAVAHLSNVEQPDHFSDCLLSLKEQA